MNIAQFIAKWEKAALTERSASQQHFLDLCELVDHPKPAAIDPTGEWFTFERGAEKHGGGDGWADVWKRGYFGWEYKGKHRALEAAYNQLLLYREALENPPLLVVCDMDRIIVRTNFTATPTVKHEIPLRELGDHRNLEILRSLFHTPDKLKPGTTSEAVTEMAARRIGSLARQLRERGLDPQSVAQFLDRIVFCLFAEDVGLLPEGIFTQVAAKTHTQPERFSKYIADLFDAMATGRDFLLQPIRHFNGNLFHDGGVLDLTAEEIEGVWAAAKLDWSAVDASVFGTLFERGLDPAKRSQLGAHYTSREDIETLVEPVVMAPLRREWAALRERVEERLPLNRSSDKRAAPTIKASRAEVASLCGAFLDKLAELKVLDPACGSGNFLYVTLQKLKDLEKEVIVDMVGRGLPTPLPQVCPWQFYGIETNLYAHDLAQMVLWIGYLQWVRFNGYGTAQAPILRKMDTFRNMDALIDLSDPDNPTEPEWPAVDFIVGNPPFLGGKKLRTELGDGYMDRLFGLWDGRVPREADLCCYWFEKARSQVTKGRCRRAGLLATQGIRGGANRRVLQRVKATGEIFWAESDRKWILDGAAVHVSMVGFDAGGEPSRVLDGQSVQTIHSNLSAYACRRDPG